MEIPKIYHHKEIENKWYGYWKDNGFFKSVPDEREPYTIVIPPPNVTGVLHMGHMLNNTIQDVLVRKARKEGKNACWVPGTDHASIATEAKVVAMLKEKGIKKADISRDEFLKYAWEWKEKYGGIILKQLEKLGASCDWDRTKFTMDNDMSAAVIDVFVDLYNKGYIYRGVRMVNWDPAGLTAVSDEEVIYKEVDSNLYYVKYPICESINIDLNSFEPTDFITIATTRPETILGDTAVCVHPNDERYKKLKGKFAIVPISNRIVPIIFDDYIDMEFGTGALKVTPAHDINDYNLGIKHKLKSIDVLNADGTISNQAGHYIGEDRFVVRKKIATDLKELNLLEKIQQIKNKVGHSERTNAVIEPKLSMQWFLDMKKISKPALDNVLNDQIKLIPEKFKNTYRHWMENVHDWCISRQLWWGQRIPAYYLPDGSIIVASTNEEAKQKVKEHFPAVDFDKEVKQDDDVLDTWFSSWLWPITVFDANVIKSGFDAANKDLQYYYPTSDLITAPEILFFWVARMAMAGYEYTGKKPFSNVYLTGIVRDKQGRKMSKSLGNSPDPLELIEKYSADGVRTGMLFSSPAGNDLLFDESLCEQGRNFTNKIWNAFRLINGWKIDHTKTQPESNKKSISWFENCFNQQLELINDHYAKYRISDALMVTYKLIWDDFCSWYLELVKPAFVNGEQEPIDLDTYNKTISLFEKIMSVLHPFTPFITEELWSLIKERNENDKCITSPWPKVYNYDEKIISTFDVVKNIISEVRNVRNKNGISPKESFQLYYTTLHINIENPYWEIIKKMANISEVKQAEETGNSLTFLAGNTQFFIPNNKTTDSNEQLKIIKEELDYLKGFLISVEKKLSNEKFMTNAKPEVIQIEEKKKADAMSKINTLEAHLAKLSN